MSKRREADSKPKSKRSGVKAKKNGQWTPPQEVRSDSVEVRCPVCEYFLCETIEIRGISILKILCRYCRQKLVLQMSPEEVLVTEL